MLSRVARVSQRLCRTPLGQHLIVRLASTEAADATLQKRAPIRTAYIKSWRPPQNIIEQWMVIREIEKKYGKVLETHFLKDFEDVGKYQMMTYIVFQDPKSVERIPKAGTELTITSRPSDKPNHEIGLEDVELNLPSGLLTSSSVEHAQEVPAADPQNDSSVLGFRIYRGKIDYVPQNIVRDRIFQKTHIHVMMQFGSWGGFAQLAPLDPSTPVYDGELFASPGTNEQKRMRAALDLCARHVARVTAAVIPPSSSIKSSPVESQPPQESPSTTPIPAPKASAPTPTPSPVSFLQQQHKQIKSKPTTANKSESPKSAPQQTSAAVPKSAETTAKETPATKPAVGTKPPSPKVSQQSKHVVVTPKTPKPAGRKLPPPVQPQPVANIRRKQPKPKIQASRSAPLGPASTWREKTVETNEAEPTPTEAPSALTRLWGLLTGKRR